MRSETRGQVVARNAIEQTSPAADPYAATAVPAADLEISLALAQLDACPKIPVRVEYLGSGPPSKRLARFPRRSTTIRPLSGVRELNAFCGGLTWRSSSSATRLIVLSELSSRNRPLTRARPPSRRVGTMPARSGSQSAPESRLDCCELQFPAAAGQFDSTGGNNAGGVGLCQEALNLSRGNEAHHPSHRSGVPAGPDVCSGAALQGRALW